MRAAVDFDSSLQALGTLQGKIQGGYGSKLDTHGRVEGYTGYLYTCSGLNTQGKAHPE